MPARTHAVDAHPLDARRLPAAHAGPARTADAGRARHPDVSGFVVRDGVRVGWERFGTGSPAVLLLPTWSIIHSRHWKLQVPDLARRTTVVTFDGRGNGRSDRPREADAYRPLETAADALAVLDALGIREAVIVALSAGARPALLLAADHADRVLGTVLIGPSLPWSTTDERRAALEGFAAPPRPEDGPHPFNAHAWRQDFRGFAASFFAECFSEPHSTKPIEDTVGWAMETDPETLILTILADGLGDRGTVAALSERVPGPTLVIHGTDDRIIPFEIGAAIAEGLRAHLVALEGSGHCPHVRDPVRVNLLLRGFIDAVARR